MALKPGSRVFLRFDSPSRGRVLQPATVEHVQDDAWTLRFDSRHHAVEIGERQLVYFSKAREFVQQPMIVESQTSAGPPFVLTLRAIGEPVAAGTREEVRVSTVESGLTAALDDEQGCPVQDVSLSGLAVISARKYPVGRCLEIAVRYGNEEFTGPVEVQSSNSLDDGSTRYGLLGVFDTSQGRALQSGLTKMTLEIQQQRLKRFSK